MRARSCSCFSIGLVELNRDGSETIDANGETIETYDNDDVVGLARVITGLSAKGGFASRLADDDWRYSRLVAYDEEHSDLEKSFLDTTIPAGTGADASISQALDTLFEHPNVAPFLSRQLIQRLTQSAPSPEYIDRVARAFNIGQFETRDGQSFGTGERGDLTATLAAIVLDEQFYDDVAPTAVEGKVREPILKFVHHARAFESDNIDSANERLLLRAVRESRYLSQAPFRSPSVFNFYRPGYVAPNTEAGEAGLTVPEFQIVNSGGMTGYNNFMLDYVLDRSPQFEETELTYRPDYSDQIALVGDPAALADNLDDLLLFGRMSDTTRQNLIDVVEAMPGEVDSDRELQAQAAVYVVVTAPEYAVQF